MGIWGGVALAGWGLVFILLLQRADQELRTGFLQQVRMVAQAVDVDNVKALTGTDEDLVRPEYRRLHLQLAAVRKASQQCRYAYFMGRRENGNIFFFVSAEPEDSPDFVAPGQVYGDVAETLRLAFEQGTAGTEGPTKDDWGVWVSGLVPIPDPRTGKVLAVLGLDVDARDWQKKVMKAVALPSGLLLVMIAAVTVAAGVWRRYRQDMDRVRDMLESRDACRPVATHSVRRIQRHGLVLALVLVLLGLAGNLALKRYVLMPGYQRLEEKEAARTLAEAMEAVQRASLARAPAERDEAFWAHVADTLSGPAKGSTLAVWPADSPALGGHEKEVLTNLMPGGMCMEEEGGDRLHVHGLLAGEEGLPMALVSVEMPREIFQQGRMAARLVSLILFLGLLAVGVVFWAWGMAATGDLLRRQAHVEALVERRTAALVKSEGHLAATLRSIGDGVATCDREGRVSSLNQVAEQLTGWSTAEALGRKVEEVFHIVDPQTRAVVENPVARALRSGRVAGLANPTVLIGRTGREFNIADSCAPVRDGEGNVAGAVLVFRDVTEEHARREALRQSEQRVQTVLENLPEGIVGLEVETRHVVFANATFCRMLGYERGELLGLSLPDLHPAASMIHVQREFNKAAAGEYVFTAELPFRRKDGSAFPSHIQTSKIELDSRVCVLAAVTDMTDRMRMEEMMLQNEKMLSVGGLAAGMAHEINNPLGGMIQTASVMSERLGNPDLPANRKAAEEVGATMEMITAFMQARGIFRMLQNIRQSGTRAAEIVSNMLSFARKDDSRRQPHDLAQLLDRCVDLAGNDYDLKKNIDFRQVQIVREYEAGLPPVPCQAGKIQQVLLNILRNGAEAMQGEGTSLSAAGGRPPRLVLRLAHEKAEKKIRIEIEDNGPGMDEATRKRVFEPFFTTKSTDRGTGLGLSVSYFIITENHGGDLWVTSEPGKGATFVIRLPLERSEA